MKKGVVLSAVILIVSLLLTACSVNQPIDNTENNSTSVIVPAESEVPNKTEKSPEKTSVIAKQILNGNDGEIHYSYYLPEDYDGSKTYPLVMTMPGYGMMWFGEDSSGSNLEWYGFRAWTELSEDVIVVSAQLTDWHETSARQAIELTEYFIANFSVDKSRVYAAGYSAGGETMSQAVSMRPDLYAAYLHGASQWDGIYEPIARMMLLCISLWLKTTNITALHRHALPMRACKELGVKRDIQMNKSANCWPSKFPTTNTLTAAEFTTTTAEEISFSMTKTF